jgi:thiol:disulfide interchange protein DsbD
MAWVRWFAVPFTALSVFLSIGVFAEGFLSPEQAFAATTKVQSDQISVVWEIEPGYYLYRDRTSAYLSNSEEHVVPINFIQHSVIKIDKNFGEMAVFYGHVEAVVDLSILSANNNSSITIEYQGCASSGLCYQPQYIEITIPANASMAPLQFALKDGSEAGSTTQKKASDNFETIESELSSTGDIFGFLKVSTFLSTVGIFFLLGVGLSLTPCILPMVPILASIIVGYGNQLSPLRGLSLAMSYVLGMSVSYALIGIFAATLGAAGNLQMVMQSPWVISIFSGMFVVLALSMFGLFTMQIPASWQSHLTLVSSNQRSGRYGGVFVMGALASLVASPCVSAPLAGALVFISSTGNYLLGASALFCLGLGMGLPLLALGAGGGKLVPKTGAWMNQVKVFFGIVLLGIGIWLLSRIISGQITLLLWATLLLFYGIYAGALEAASEGVERFRKAISFSVLFYGCVLMIGAVTGGTDPFAPFANLNGKPFDVENRLIRSLEQINSRTELNFAVEQANKKGQLVMLDFYADWCTSCINMEREVFADEGVHNILRPFRLLQVDVTDNSSESREILDLYGLFGPPAILFLGASGRELSNTRVQGELDRLSFIDHIATVVSDNSVCPGDSVDRC